MWVDKYPSTHFENEEAEPPHYRHAEVRSTPKIRFKNDSCFWDFNLFKEITSIMKQIFYYSLKLH